jgi:hypothetical protein
MTGVRRQVSGNTRKSCRGSPGQAMLPLAEKFAGGADIAFYVGNSGNPPHTTGSTASQRVARTTALRPACANASEGRPIAFRLPASRRLG